MPAEENIRLELHFQGKTEVMPVRFDSRDDRDALVAELVAGMPNLTHIDACDDGGIEYDTKVNQLRTVTLTGSQLGEIVERCQLNKTSDADTITLVVNGDKVERVAFCQEDLDEGTELQLGSPSIAPERLAELLQKGASAYSDTEARRFLSGACNSAAEGELLASSPQEKDYMKRLTAQLSILIDSMPESK